MKHHAIRKMAKYHFANLKDIKEDGADDVLKKVRTADFLANQRLSSNSINEKLTDVFSLRHQFFEVDR